MVISYCDRCSITCVCFMDSASSLSGGGCNSTPVENVGVSGVDISIEDFENKIKQQEGIINFVYRQNIVDDALLRDQVWDYYVKKIIMENEFDKIGLDISDEEWVLKIKDQNNTHEILKKLFTDSSGVYNGELAWSQIQQISQLPDGDQQKLWKDCEESILFDYKFQKYQTLIGQSMYATSHEAKDNILFNKQNVRFDYVAIPFTNINNEDIVITDNDIENYYSKNKANYKKQSSNDVELIFSLQNLQKRTIMMQNHLFLQQLLILKVLKNIIRLDLALTIISIIMFITVLIYLLLIGKI